MNIATQKKSHVRHLFAIGAVLASTAPAAAQGDAPDPRGTRCVVNAVIKLDDRVSDARSVAAAVVASCRKERFRAMKLTGPERDELIERALDRMRETDIDGVTAIVLEYRRKMR